MRTGKISIALVCLLCLASNNLAQRFANPVDDGAGAYASGLAKFHGTNVANVLKKKDFEPFAVSFFGWRALAIARLPYNKYEGTHLDICRLALSLYDKEIDAVLQTLANRPTSMTAFAQATEAEQSAIQKFVAQKYGAKYLQGIGAIFADTSKGVPPKKDEADAWKYSLGARLGDLAGSVTKWFAFPNNARYDESISETLRNLQKEIKEAPKDTSPDLLASLNRLSAFGSKKSFSADERLQIGTAIGQALQATMSFAKPLSKPLEDFANAVDKAQPATTAPTTKPNPPPTPAPAATDTAKAKEIANQYLQMGIKKYDNNLSDPAIDDFNRALALDPDNAAIYYQRGRALIQKQDYDKAIADLTKAINLGGITSADDYHLSYRALAYIRKNDLTAAITDLNQALSLNGRLEYGYYLRGSAYRMRGNLAQARSDFQAALKINPNYQYAKDELAKLDAAGSAPPSTSSATAKPTGAPTTSTPTPSAPAGVAAPKAKELAEQLRQQGLAKFNNKQLDAALDDYNKAAELDPTNQYVYSNRGQALLAKGEVDKAILDFTKAINLGGITADDHYYLNDRGRAYFQKGQMEMALADLNLAISLYAKNVYGYYLRGFIHKTQGNTAQARSDFQAALAINPNYQLAKDELAKLGK